MSFNLFGSAQKGDIRVGYIDPERGFVDGLTVCDANKYAKLNPGTQFIFRRRDTIQYMNINEVNRLQGEDLTPANSSYGEDGCSGIEGLDIYNDDGTIKDQGEYPVTVEFTGGNGIGAKGNPIFGDDGGLLAVDLIDGGWGYSYAPITKVFDQYGIGAGAVVRSIMIGDPDYPDCKFFTTVQTFENEEDFEDYDLSSCPEIAGFGRRYNAEGKDIGPWDPTVYANLQSDPVRIEIQRYQDFLLSLKGGQRISFDDNIIRNWWTTRRFKPLKVTSQNKTSRTIHNVDYPAWTEFMNQFAVSPVPPSNVPGSDFAGIGYQLEWEEDFPHDGDYIFKYLADNVADVYLDNELIGRTKRFKGVPDKLKKFVKGGVHRIRIDLENIPIYSEPGTQKEVFNTKEYINKADRKLWRINPGAGRDGDFLSQYGVLPFNPDTEEARTDDYAGTHVIRWEYVDFPEDGNYNIEVMVDDDVDIYIGNRSGDGRMAIGNGLISVDEGGDEVIIRKKGFSGPGKSTGKSLETKFFLAGKYRIRAELKQIRGKGISNGNPMALAIRIKTAESAKQVVSAKSWNENPMGVALSIDAPLPPIPQEPKPVAEGRCPNNPIWTTRFPGSADRWFPVTHPAWSRFTNRYAMSPIPPLGTPDSEGGGIVYRTSWVIEAPYSGFYGMKGTVDNGGRILVDNKEILRGGYFTGATFAGSKTTLKGFRTENPETVKFPLSEGRHTITVEVENKSNVVFKTIDKKVFSTSDWLTPLPTQTTTTTTSETTTKEEWERIEDAFVPPISGTGRSSTTITIPDDASFHKYSEGTYYKGKQIRTGGDWNNTDPYTNYIEWDSDTRLTLGNYHPESSERFAIAVWKKTITTETGTQTVTTTTPVATASQSPSAKGVVYVGPTQITSYKKGFLSPLFQDVNANPNEEIQGKTWVMRWENVDFPIDGTYKIRAEVDDSVEVFVDGQKVATAELGVRGTSTDPYRYSQFNATRGKRTVELRLSNIRIPNTGFEQNPTVVKVDITAPVSVETGKGQSWQINPVGISAILIPPPCPLEVVGKGKVCRVVVDDPGNGYPKPPDAGTGDNTYPVTLELDGIEVVNPGINYNCGVDQLVIQPSNGATLSYECDTFGRIVKVNVDKPGRGFTRQPTITMPSDTGVNFQAVPRFRVVRDPVVDVQPEQIIQVTDLVGLKLTGYVNGRAYYGSVFYKEGVRYAGIYETPGQLIQVYDTLQESINAEVTTPPSAILRQGTDVRSNNPRLNIPGTPDTLT